MNTTPGAPTDAQIEAAMPADVQRSAECHKARWLQFARAVLSLPPAPSAALAAPVASPEPVAHICGICFNRPECCDIHDCGDAHRPAPIAPSPPTTPPAAEPGAPWTEQQGELIDAVMRDTSTGVKYRMQRIFKVLAVAFEEAPRPFATPPAPSTAQGLSDADVDAIIEAAEAPNDRWWKWPTETRKKVRQQVRDAILEATGETK